MDLHFFTKSDWLHIYEKEERNIIYFFTKSFWSYFSKVVNILFLLLCKYLLRTVATYLDSSEYIVVGDNSCRYWRHVLSPLSIYCHWQNMCRYWQFILRLKGRQNMRKTLTHIVAGDRIYRQNWNKCRQIVFLLKEGLCLERFDPCSQREMETLDRHQPVSWTFVYTWHKRFKDG